jgi:CHAD domain-containing protein
MGLTEAAPEPETTPEPEAMREPEAKREPEVGPEAESAPDPQHAPPDPATANTATEEVEGAPARPVLGPPPGPIQPTDPFAVAGRKAMWLHVSRMLEREDSLRDPKQTDAVKRYRVATRRLRAALRVFRDAYPNRETKPLRRSLAELAGALGRVRDLDVRLEEVDRWAEERGDVTVAALAPLRGALTNQRRAAAAALHRKLGTKGHQRLLADLVDFVTDVDTARGLDDGVPDRMTRDRAASAIWTRYEEVRAFVSVVRWADLPTLHGLRVEAKRLRYTIEFLGAVLGPDREWLVERLVALQDHLGALNDATLAATAVRAFLSEHHAALAPDERAATITYLADRERERNRLRRSVGRAWRPIVSTTFGRRLGRAVVVRPTA